MEMIQAACSAARAPVPQECTLSFSYTTTAGRLVTLNVGDRVAETDGELKDLVERVELWHEKNRFELRIDSYNEGERLRLCCASHSKKRSANQAIHPTPQMPSTRKQKLSLSKRITKCPVAISFRFDGDNDLYGPHWYVSSIPSVTHNHRPVLLNGQVAIRHIRNEVGPTVLHQHLAHLVPNRSIVSQLAEKGFILSTQELRNLISWQTRQDQPTVETSMSETAQLIQTLDSRADIAYVALFTKVMNSMNVSDEFDVTCALHPGESVRIDHRNNYRLEAAV
jgi:hypothetical protein